MPDTKVLFNLARLAGLPERVPWTSYSEFILSISKKFLRKFSQCIRLTLWNRRKKANNRNKGKAAVEIHCKNTPQNSLSSRIWKNPVLCINIGFPSVWFNLMIWVTFRYCLHNAHNQKEVLYMRHMQGCPFLKANVSFWRRVKGSHTSTSSLWSCIAKWINRWPRTHLNSSNPGLPENKEKYFWSILIFSIAIHKSEFTYWCKTPNANEHFESTWTDFWASCLIGLLSWALVSPGAQGTHPH